MLKEKLLKVLRNELGESDRKLLSLFTITEQKNGVVFRMPKTLFTLDILWEHIEKIANKNKIKISKTGIYATVEELDEILTDIEWMWKSHIPYGFVTMVAGEPGIGKSLFALDIANIVTNGKNFPNTNQRCEKGKVFWIDTEMKQQLLNSRSKSLGVDRSRLLIPAVNGNLLKKLDAGNEEDKQHIISALESEKPSMLVMDSLGHAHSKGENKIEDVRPIMDFLTGIARDFNIAVMVVHHLNKGRQDEVAEVSLSRVRGSTDITATPVVIYSLEKGAGDTIRLRQIKNNIAKQQPALIVKLDYNDDEEESVKSLNYEPYVPPPPKKNKKEMCAEWVYDMLAKNEEGMALTDLIDIGAGLGFSRGNIYSSREVLGEQLRFTGTGNKAFWHLNDTNDKESIEKIRKRKQK